LKVAIFGGYFINRFDLSYNLSLAFLGVRGRIAQATSICSTFLFPVSIIVFAIVLFF